MRVFDHLKEWRTRRKSYETTTTVGFVPTMGALHRGHLELVRRCKVDNDICVVSIFVNPTQFNNADDLKKYPRTLDADIQLLESVAADYLILPTYEDLYADNYRYKVSENELSQQLCGKYRPGHFDGVLTVVMKLLNVVHPTRIYLGEKDYQQLQLIRGMVDAFFIPTEVVAVPTVREDSGLALSSRNARLSDAGRKYAVHLIETLRESSSASAAHERLASRGFDVDYVEDIGGRRYAAAWIEGVRLIDNIEIPSTTPMSPATPAADPSKSLEPNHNLVINRLVTDPHTPEVEM
jgi:pantoate--beta-alanine ligase